MNSIQYFENRTFDEIEVGDCAELSRILKPEDVGQAAAASNGAGPIASPATDSGADGAHATIAHGIWSAALISALLDTELPGPGAQYLNQRLTFGAPIAVGDTATARITATEKNSETSLVTFACECVGPQGAILLTGEVDVIAPREKARRPRTVPPEAPLTKRGENFTRLLDATRPLDPIPTAIVHPCDARSLNGALRARAETLIEPVLVGPTAKIRNAAKAADIDISELEIVDAPHSHAAAEKAVELVHKGHVEALMKGALHTDEVMSAVIDRETGLRTERRMSHVFVMDAPSYPKPLLITDAAINIYPNLDDKRDIVQNAIDLARTLGIERPKVAILSAVETVYPKMTSTIEAAALCKMADRGQIKGGVLDGPLAFDNAISKEAAKTKAIISEVAGDADILIAPDLEAGNMIAKQLIYLAGADAAGIVLGARVPVMLTSRSDGELSRIASAALAQLYVHRIAQTAP